MTAHFYYIKHENYTYFSHAWEALVLTDWPHQQPHWPVRGSRSRITMWRWCQTSSNHYLSPNIGPVHFSNFQRWNHSAMHFGLEFARLRRSRVGCHKMAEWAEAGSPRGLKTRCSRRVRGPSGRAGPAR